MKFHFPKLIVIIMIPIMPKHATEKKMIQNLNTSPSMLGLLK